MPRFYLPLEICHILQHGCSQLVFLYQSLDQPLILFFAILQLYPQVSYGRCYIWGTLLVPLPNIFSSTTLGIVSLPYIPFSMWTNRMQMRSSTSPSFDWISSLLWVSWIPPHSIFLVSLGILCIIHAVNFLGIDLLWPPWSNQDQLSNMHYDSIASYSMNDQCVFCWVG